MKLRIGFLMIFGVLLMFSCQQDDALFTEGKQTEDINKRNDGDQLPVIFVHWGDNIDDPVQGALVFDLATNELVTETDDAGNAYIEPLPRKYRVVDPQYGSQQAIVVYPNDFEYDDIFGGKRKIIGWTIDGDPIYE